MVATYQKPKHIVIIGGGAGGLELAIRLSKKFPKRQVQVTLVDESLNYIWKPLYHEVAVGTVDYSQNEINYITYAHRRNINFVFGSFCALNQPHKYITVAPVYDEAGQIVVQERRIHYNYLVIAVGSVSNTFGIPGVNVHCYFLDRLSQADRFQKYFLYQILAFIQSNKYRDKKLKVAIVGGGATGVELAAELRYAFSKAITYGAKPTSLLKNLEIIIIEGADRILPNLTQDISENVTGQLQQMGIQILTGQRVIKAEQDGLETQTKQFINADVMVWAAGIKAPEFLTQLGLETNRINQLVVKPTLQTTRNDHIFAIGDCSSCPDPQTHSYVPPRAQAARQEAIYLTKAFKKLFKEKPLSDYIYRDYGSLVSLSRHNVVGNLMGKAVGTFFIEGKIAQFSYLLLHKEHQATLFGFWKAFLLTLSNLFTRKIKSGIKLH